MCPRLGVDPQLKYGKGNADDGTPSHFRGLRSKKNTLYGGETVTMRPPLSSTTMWSYTALLRALDSGSLQQGVLLPSARLDVVDTDGAMHSTQLLPMQVASVMDSLATHNVDVSVLPPSALSTMLRPLLDLLPVLLFGYLLLTVLRQPSSGSLFARMTPGGRRTTTMDVVTDVDTSFDDVAGLETAKEELMEVVDYLRDPERFVDCGARAPTGVLLEGPPGTGKTLLARAVAGEANASFIPTTASSFVEMYVGLGAARVRGLFERAHACAPCIVWIDEIDAVARRSGPQGGRGEEVPATRNARPPSTNSCRPWTDFRETRGSSCWRRPTVPTSWTTHSCVRDISTGVPIPFRPRWSASASSRYTRNKRLDAGVDLAAVARRTSGFSGAELSNLMNEAAIRTMRRRGDATTMDDVTDALERVTVGLPRPSAQTDEVRERIAVHEMGHAIVGTELDAYDDVLRVTIVPRSSGAGGFTSFSTREDRSVDGLYTRDYLMAQLTVLLAGRAAEALVLGEDTVSVGASSDIDRAQQLVERMVLEWGMGSDGVVLPKTVRGSARLSHIDSETERLLDAAYTLATSILSEKRSELLSLTRTLLDHDTLDGSTVRTGLLPPP